MKELVLGSLSLHPVLMAPMAGITDKPFRRLVAEQGCGLAYTEMISSKAICYQNRRTWKMLDIRGEHPVGVQLFGNDAAVMAAAAQTAQAEGAAVIDINMGCPVAKVVGNGEGAALMRNPRLASSLVAAVCDAVTVPVTVKIRAGWDSRSVNAVEFAREMVAAGASAVTVHGRTREQMYSGKADWSIIARVAESVKAPVIGNGDIKCGRDAVAMLEQTGCSAVMVARGAMGYPWIFAEINAAMTGQAFDPPDCWQRVRMALRHLELELAYREQRLAVLQMRKHFAWYIKGMPGATKLKQKLFRETEPEKIKDMLLRFGQQM